MKYAIISDVHGNLPALEAVLEDADFVFLLPGSKQGEFGLFVRFAHMFGYNA